ncbi:U-box domain-containing protein 52 isoform X2 [Jatropha curcas]|uniref:U-box domain-containing protein 52 isoform X2 n=1 Tax=Jatropha curcas TaxID=180498 RepID=UPI0009D6BE9C|nr:U-box domain-containing protein 52 isoform X2 [Jatropha curcas]
MALVPADDVLSLVNATAVAIDKDKNSQQAVRWAIDHLIINNPVIILVHVRHKNHQYNGANGNDPESDEVQQLFIPFRGYCARKGVQLREVVLDDSDVARALLDYISKHYIGSIAVGASTRNALTRKFKNQDVPTSLVKSAPDFCSVYVISKGKIVSARTAQRPAANPPIPPKSPPLALPAPNHHDHSEHEDGTRGGKGYLRNTGSDKHHHEKTNDSFRAQLRERNRTPSNLSLDSIDISFPGTGTAPRMSIGRDSTSEDSEFSGSYILGSSDGASQISSADFSMGSHNDGYLQNARELEAEMRRLKLELKQTIDMYSTACREALNAKKKANELHQWKMEEARRFEEARNAEEAALAIAEIEKAKCKAAMEAADKAQRLAEMEAQKRKYAEMKAKREAEEKKRALNALAHDVRYRKYTIEEIEASTEKFSQSNKIGEGGYGPVYKGKLDHTPVAIKVLRPDAAQGKKQFQQEVEVLSCIRHPNMVLLLGACPEYGCLVYEYMENGSLEDRLLRRENTPPISWRRRFKIASEIATALLFLHQAKPEPLVHRDLKPANILLDRNYVSKISDVGLARLVPQSVADSVTQYHMTSAAGTFCYIDPEYQQTGMLTTRSDIYSFGIMLLQIITAKPPMGLAHRVGKAIEKGTFEEMLDPAVSDWPVEEALSFAKMALKCAELRKKDRPSLATDIVPELNRLRDLGRNSDHHSGSRTDHGHHGRHGHGSRSRSRSPLTHSNPTNSYQRVSNPIQREGEI